MSIKNIELINGEYAAKWGLTDFYPEAEQKLKDLLASGEDFTTTYGCKKEIRYCEITKDTGADDLWVTVTAWMDDLWDGDALIYDTMKEEIELPEDIIYGIREAAIDCEIDDHTTLSILLPASATYADVIEAIESLEAETEEGNTNMFDRLAGIVEDHIQYMKENVDPAAPEVVK
jgi:hypothetical protein